MGTTRMKPNRPAVRRKQAVPLLLGAAALAGAAGEPRAIAAVQSAALIAGAQAAPSDALSGRDFGGIDLPATPQRMNLSFAAMRGWSWREGSAGCSRLFFEKDVRVSIGPYRFVADRASVWLEPVLIGGVEGEQLALYLENARDPSGPGELLRDGTPSPSGPWLSQSAARLLVTAVVITDPGTPTSVAVDLPMRDGRPAASFVSEGEARLARYLADVSARAAARAGVTPDGSRTPWSGPTIRAADRSSQADSDPLPPAQGTPPTGPGGRDLTIDTRVAAGRSPIAVRTSPIVPREALVQFASPNPRMVEVDPASDAARTGATRALLLTGGVTVQYDTLGRRQSVLLESARAVVFLARAPGADTGMRFSQADVLGVYLEGDAQVSVRTSPDAAAPGFRPDQYVLRGSRMYYDLQRNSAVVLDAVFWTYDQERGMPLYLRADVLRQRSLQEFTAEKATLANVSFAEPHFAIGASSVTVTRDTSSEGRAFSTYEARDLVFTAGGVPLAYVPKVSGEFKPSPLRRIEFESVSDTSVVRSVWDMYTLLGLDAPEGNRWDLLIDWYISRGIGVGTDLRWTRPDIDGSLLAYYLNDRGKDHLSSGADREPPQENRGLIAADNIWRLDEHWTLFAEGTYISDEAFVDSFFRREAQTRREFISSLYLRRLEDNEAITAEVRGTFNDFISNQYLLTSQGYQVQKLPDFAYHRIGEDLFGGLLSYTADARFTSTNLAFDSATLADHGYDTRDRSEAGFGLLPTDRLSRTLAASGLDEDTVTRFDTRHDIEAPLSMGPVNVTPFAVGRFTAYDTGFDDFNSPAGPGGAGAESIDRERYWGAAGLRAATSLNRVDSSVKSDVLDLHGVRHIITPSLTAWSSGTNVEQSDLPVYDEGVESLADGTSVRAGIENVWQTHRPSEAPGSRGTLRSVDWLRINTDYVWSSGDVDRETPFGRFIEARPERSSLGEFVTADAIMQLTDAVAITGDVLYDVEERTTSRAAAGAIVDHGDGFSTFVEYRSLDPLDSKNIDFGARYELTRKYAATLQSVYDLDNEEFQSVGGRLTRRFPQWTVEVGFHLSTITDESSIGFVLSPVGATGETRRRIFTREFDDVAPTPRQRDAVRDRLDDGPFAD